MIVRSVLTFLLCLNAYSQKIVDVKETQLNVAVGIDEIVKFDYKFNPKVKIGKDDILNLIISPSKREITFKGIKPGKTSVTIRDAAGDIKDKYIVEVTADGPSNVVRELRELIGDIEGIEIEIKGGKVVVGGSIVVPDQLIRINTIMSRYPEVIMLIDYAKQTQVLVAKEMQEAINRNGMKDVTVNVVNGDYWLEGVVNNEGKKTVAKNIAAAFLPNRISAPAGLGVDVIEKGKIADFITVNEKKDPEPPPKLVKISSQFVELSKDYLKVFSFKWAPFMSNESQISFGRNTVGEDNAETGGITTRQDGTLSGTISRLFPKLLSAKNAGYARVIQSGMAVTNNNQQITIKKESKINFAVGTGQGQEAKEASISFVMSTKPVIKTQENVELQGLNINVSLPSSTDAAGNPQTTSNEVRTQITVKSKESAVIGGIVQSNSATNYDKNDPDQVQAAGGAAGGGAAGGGAVGGNANNSANQATQLFNLLRSKSYTTKKSQFVVFVTPEILESASKGTEKIRRKFRKRQR